MLSWNDWCLKKLKNQSQNPQNRRSGEKANNIYETYKNTVMPHGRHIYTKAYDMEKATMCAYPQSDHALPHWKCVLRCFANVTCINIPDQETDHQYSDTTTSIRFHIYHTIVCCTENGRIPFKDKKIYVASVNKNLQHTNIQKCTLEKS